ncbi:MAG: HAD-IB family phosphatase [Thaumarchaeota archaeon]|nr:HAD-IB family phosphatase [Nitrososphaerota archaeon]
MKPEIVLASFDMDGTLLEHDSSWVAIHRHFGTTESGEASLKLYGEGKIDYREFMRRDISSWPRGVTRQAIDHILSRYKVRKEAPRTLEELRRRGIKTALVTSGIDILAEKVAEELRIDYWVANGLRFGRDGVVLPEGLGRVDPTRKDLAYKRLLGRIGVPSKKTIAVGDTIYDLRFLKSAAIGFMLAHTTRVSDPQIIHIDKLSEIFDHL